ncbi:hypothetical protein BDA96_06G042200 [Sorghum bicolor]|jgi:hypothetical protein|uniref:Uncharacterized protein n=2 Tax=Sorghum bicolor TaxID=4558 RepID=A0A921UAX0_SORBI|nr:hypothetical protein BDA96_06G042200 [Sorghum bicolor]KXG25978.1 hypothetical protein SORBI_3006G038600 [Sorghum bicolor]
MMLHPGDFTTTAGHPRIARNYISSSAIGLRTTTSTPTTQAFPSSILLLKEWAQHILSSATIAFFDNNGQQFLSIEDIYISR